MFYSQVILAKKGPLAKVWLAAHWGDKKLGRPQIFATDISQSVESIVNPTVPLALRVSGHLLLGVVRIYSRKVKYVLNDCTEAMLKLQMAFLPRKDLLEQNESSENKNTTVANFGEYDQVHVVEGFSLPLPDQNEWILAEDDDDEEEVTEERLPSQLEAASPAAYQPPEEETWVPFDPENDDEEDEVPNNSSRVSDVEIVRAADESFLSGDQVRSRLDTLFHNMFYDCYLTLSYSCLQTRRDSSLLVQEKSDLIGAPPTEQQEDDDFGEIAFEDSEDEDRGPLQDDKDVPDDSLLQLSRASDVNDNTIISGLDESREETVGEKRPSPEPKRRRRKRRKVVIDNNATELSSEHIKDMIANTDDIVRRQVHPAEEESVYKPQAQPYEPVLTRPFLADDGQLHPALAQLWRQNFYRALEEPCSYQRIEPVDDVEQVREEREEPASDMEEDENEIVKEGAFAQEEEEPDFDNGFDMDEEEEEPQADAAQFDDSDEEGLLRQQRGKN